MGEPTAREQLQAAIEAMDADPYRVTWLYVCAALEACNGNRSAAARRLGMHRRTLQRIILQRWEPSNG